MLVCPAIALQMDVPLCFVMRRVAPGTQMSARGKMDATLAAVCVGVHTHPPTYTHPHTRAPRATRVLCACLVWRRERKTKEASNVFLENARGSVNGRLKKEDSNIFFASTHTDSLFVDLGVEYASEPGGRGERR